MNWKGRKSELIYAAELRMSSRTRNTHTILSSYETLHVIVKERQFVTGYRSRSFVFMLRVFQCGVQRGLITTYVNVNSARTAVENHIHGYYNDSISHKIGAFAQSFSLKISYRIHSISS